MKESLDTQLLTQYTPIDILVLKDMLAAPRYHGNVCNIENGPHAFTICLSLDLRARFQVLPEQRQAVLLRIVLARSHGEEDIVDEDEYMDMITEYEKWRQATDELNQLHRRLCFLFSSAFSDNPAIPSDWQYGMYHCDTTSMAFLCFINTKSIEAPAKVNQLPNTPPPEDAVNLSMHKVAPKCFQYVAAVEKYGKQISREHEFVLAKKRATNECSETKLTLFRKFGLHDRNVSSWTKKIPHHIRMTVFQQLCFFNMPDERFILKKR